MEARKKILITGSGGFVGRNLAEYYVTEDYPVLGMTRSQKRPLSKALYTSGIYGDKIGDLLDMDVEEMTAQLEGKADVIIHAAAQSPYNSKNIGQYIDNNIQATRRILQLAQRLKTKQFIYLSGISVYGDVREPEVNEDTDILNPGHYGLTKYQAEEIVRENSNTVPSVILRLPGILGPGAHTPWLAGVNLPLTHCKSLMNDRSRL